MTDKKKGLGSSFLGAIGIEITDDPPKGPAARQTPLPPPPNGGPVTVHPNGAGPGVTASPPPFAPVFMPAAPTADPVMLQRIQGILMNARPKVYAEFSTHYENLKEVIPDLPDPSLRIKAALKTSGAKPEQLVQSIDMLLQTVDSAEQDFNRSFETQQQQVTSVEQQISAHRAQITALEAEIQQLSAKREQTIQRNNDARSGFDGAVAYVRADLTRQKTQIGYGMAAPRGQ